MRAGAMGFALPSKSSPPASSAPAGFGMVRSGTSSAEVCAMAMNVPAVAIRSVARLHVRDVFACTVASPAYVSWT